MPGRSAIGGSRCWRRRVIQRPDRELHQKYRVGEANLKACSQAATKDSSQGRPLEPFKIFPRVVRAAFVSYAATMVSRPIMASFSLNSLRSVRSSHHKKPRNGASAAPPDRRISGSSGGMLLPEPSSCVQIRTQLSGSVGGNGLRRALAIRSVLGLQLVEPIKLFWRRALVLR